MILYIWKLFFGIRGKMQLENENYNELLTNVKKKNFFFEKIIVESEQNVARE